MTTVELIKRLKDLKVVPILDGHLVKLVGQTNSLSAEFIEQIHLGREELITYLKKNSRLLVDAEHIVPVSHADAYPASNGQKRMWMLCRKEGGNLAYHINAHFIVQGEIVSTLLQEAVRAVIERHESLRTLFEEKDGALYQIVLPKIPFNLAVSDINHVTRLKSFIWEEARKFGDQPFDLAQGPLLRMHLFIKEGLHSVLLLSMHHIISDGASVALFLQEVFRNYEAILRIGRPDSEPLKIQYNDFSAWQASRVIGEAGTKAAEFFRRRFAACGEPLNLLTDYPRQNTKDFRGNAVRSYFDQDLYSQILQFCRSEQITPFNFFRAVLTVFLYKISGQTNIIFGVPVSARNHVDLDEQIGLYVNTLPFQATVDGGFTFRKLLDDISIDSARMLEFQDYPFDMIVDVLDIRSEKGRNLFFDVLMVFQDSAVGDGSVWSQVRGNFDMVKLETWLKEEEAHQAISHFCKFDLTFSFGIDPGYHAYFEIEYAVSLFSTTTIASYFSIFLQIASEALIRPESAINALSVTDADAREWLITNVSGLSHDFPSEQTLLGLFEEQVSVRSESIAMVVEGKEYSYRELFDRSTRLGAYLCVHYGVGHGDRVGVCLSPGVEMIISLLAVLRCGAAYVPIDPEFPLSRMEYIISDSGSRVVIDASEFMKWERSGNDPATEGWRGMGSVAGRSTDLVYVMYTSGSTGQPKGCMLEHRGVINRLAWMWSEYGFTSSDVILQKTSFTFDVSVVELFLPLCWGARMVVCPRSDAGSPERILSLIEQEGVTYTHFVPGMLDAFIAGVLDREDIGERLKRLRCVVASGEALTAATVKNWYDRLEIPLHNLYGPTEASIDVTAYTTRPGSTKVPIGRPIWNTQIYILGTGDQLVPQGIAGEICIGGVGLARGYYNQPELTASKFIMNPFAAGGKLYRTGDRGRWLADGNIEYLGRNDEQVKIRGYRIEPGEIENALLHCPSVISAAVAPITSADGEKELTAFLQASEAINPAEIKRCLAGFLPNYFIPAHFVQLAEFPRTASGKIDKHQLNKLSGTLVTTESRVSALQTETQRKLASLWIELLGERLIGRESNFFHLGGHSLKATKLNGRISQVFGVRANLKDIFNAPELEGMSSLIDQLRTTDFSEIPKAKIKNEFPLSDTQRRLWSICQFKNANIAYNMSGNIFLSGKVNKDALEKSLISLVNRHESLRTVFRQGTDGVALQAIRPIGWQPGPLTFCDLSEFPDKDDRCRSSIRQQAEISFDLNRGPLFTLCLYKLASETSVLACVIHHLIADGWSVNVLIRDLMHFYTQYSHQGNLTPFLLPLRIQYTDYVEWQRDQLKGPHFEKQRTYWVSQFKAGVPVLNLQQDHERRGTKSYCGATVHAVFDRDIVNGLRNICKGKNATLYMGLLATVNLLLHKYTGDKDIVIGSPIAGRSHPDLDDQIGFYANTLAIRTKFPQGINFNQLLAQIKTSTISAIENQDYQLDELLDVLQISRDPLRNPFFEVEVVLQNDDQLLHQAVFENGLQLSVYPIDDNTPARFELTFDFTESTEGLKLELVYNADLFERTSISLIVHYLRNLLQNIIIDPDAPLERVSILDLAEKKMLVEGYNDTAASFPRNATLGSLFEEQVKRIPDLAAVVFENRKITYSDLYQKATKLANFFTKMHAVSRDQTVGILLERSENAIVAILAVSLAGAAYVPIDPAFPADRVKFILDDSKAKILITDTHGLLNLNWFDGYLFAIDAQEDEFLESFGDRLPEVKSDDLAYIIYTSGSTGRPKGVMIEHRMAINTILSQCRIFEMQEGDRHLQFASLSFDASVSEIFVSLLSGGELHIVSDTIKMDADLLTAYIDSNNIDLATLPPALLRVINIEKIRPLKKLVSAGEPAIVEKLSSFAETGIYFNAYGPTESSICGTIFRNDIGSGLDRKKIPIGKPIDNTQIYILDENQELLPVGRVGEICISGAGIARGYINDPILTEKKFKPDPFKAGNRLYQTGDLGRWLEDGQIEFIGRRDGQGKIRGYRVETGEIEAVLESYTPIQSAAVLIQKDAGGENEIVAYVVFGEENIPGFEDLNIYVGNYLPTHMLPSRYLRLPSMPLTPSLKIDRNVLLSVDGVEIESEQTFVHPRNGTESTLLEIWKEVLKKQHISVTGNFFELGGHSLKATRLVNLIHTKTGVRLELKDIFLWPILEEQASLVVRTRGIEFANIPIATAADSYVLSSAQFGIWLACQDSARNSVYNVPTALWLEGPLNINALESAFHSLIARHESLRTVFREFENGEPRQFVLDVSQVGFHIHFHDARNEMMFATDPIDFLTKELLLPFNLEQGPLFRACLYQEHEKKYLLGFVMHHIITDGWSMDVIIRELLALYSSDIEPAAAKLTPLPIQYRDYAVWQQRQLAGNHFEANKKYWMQQFTGPLPALDLRRIQPRPTVKNYEAGEMESEIGAERIKTIKAFCYKNTGSLFMALLTAVNLVLSRISGQNDIIVGSPIAGRGHVDLQDQVGLYVNTLAIRTQIPFNITLANLFDIVKCRTLEAYENQLYPFDALIGALEIPRDKSRSFLFDTWMVLQNTERGDIGSLSNLGDIVVSPFKGKLPLKMKYDLLFRFIEIGDVLKLNLEYNRDIVDERLARSISVQVDSALNTLGSRPETMLGDAIIEMEVFEKERNLAEGRIRRAKSLVSLRLK